MYPFAVPMAAAHTTVVKPPPPKVAVSRPRSGSSLHAVKNFGGFTVMLPPSPLPPAKRVARAIPPSTKKKQAAYTPPVPKPRMAFALPILPAQPSSGYKFGTAGFTPLPPFAVAPHQLSPRAAMPPKRMAAASPVRPRSVPASRSPKRPASDDSYALTPVTDTRPLAGSNRPVELVVQELAAREKIKVVVGPTEGRRVTLRLGEMEPEDALRQVAAMAGLALQRQDDIWYVATPAWMAQAFPERQYTQVVRFPSGDAGEVANALQTILNAGAEVDVIGGNHLVVKASLKDLEAASQVLALWHKPGVGKSELHASIVLDVPRGLDETLFQLAGNDGKPGVERTNEGRSLILRGSPTEVLTGLKGYVAVVEKAALPATAVAHRMRH